ncbi:MAG: chromosome segregation protein ScpA [Calditrichaeota bacterium]|nr:MAG: chromosome segregation protein ScpA [Calditrichota bacterium]MBL1206580.1 chromosome segregation protein ScpA [Calditrichota bacterium]NOG46407.1 segregation/condensation protein A [Calditrichota bacterium]
MIYKVKLDIFEGPFDLLLFLIRKNEVDIYDIPIFKITKQFLDYIEVMKILDLDIAGDFIEMCAILMSIKARYLLPRPESDEDDEIDDPRTELVERLIEYKKFKEASIEMEELEEKRSRMFGREYFNFIPKTEDISDEDYLDDATLFDLVMAFRTALDNMPKIHQHEVQMIKVTVEEQSDLILLRLQSKPLVLFQDLMKELKEKIVIIVTFIALLDLVKNGMIEVSQSHVYDDIRIKPRTADTDNISEDED